MWRHFSPAAEKHLAGSHTAISRVDVLHGGLPVCTLDVVSGSVTAEAGRSVYRALAGCTLVDPTGALSGGDVDDLLNPYDCEIAPYRGVRYTVTTVSQTTLTPAAGGLGVQPLGTSGLGGVNVVPVELVSTVEEWAPLGVFGLTSRQTAGDGSVEVTGQDRAMGYQGPMTGTLAISGSTPVEQAIYRLLATRNPGVAFAQTWVTGYTVGPLLYDAGIDVWKEAQALARSVGGWLYHDRQGGLVFSSVLPSLSTPVARFADGENTGLISLQRQEDSDTIHNVVVVESVKTATGGVIRAVAEDADPTSPTYAGGRYGRRPVTIPNQHVGSVQQAQQMAATELVRELGRSETVSAVIVPDPRLDPLDVASLHRPRAGLLNRGMVIASLETPLGVEDTMPVTFQKSVLAQDGSVIELPFEGVS